MEQIACVGFGEAAQAFVSGWGALRPARITAYDIKLNDPQIRAALLDRAAAHTVAAFGAPGDALADTPVVFSLVTADQALTAARTCAAHLVPGALWLDCNSCAPDTKRAAAAIITAAGGRYVDVAVMAPVHPKKHHVPLLLSGPCTQDAMTVLTALDMRPAFAGDTVGQASAIKMLRSVMIKGIEALSAECFLAARQAGVEDAVIASLDASDPGANWRKRGAYNLERMMVHGARRAAEMREVAVTVSALGLTGRMAAATADWQDEIAATQTDPGPDDLILRADALLRVL